MSHSVVSGDYNEVDALDQNLIEKKKKRVIKGHVNTFFFLI